MLNTYLELKAISSKELSHFVIYQTFIKGSNEEHKRKKDKKLLIPTVTI